MSLAIKTIASVAFAFVVTRLAAAFLGEDSHVVVLTGCAVMLVAFYLLTKGLERLAAWVDVDEATKVAHYWWKLSDEAIEQLIVEEHLESSRHEIWTKIKEHRRLERGEPRNS